MGTYSLIVLSGDGIGPEVTEQAVRALEAIASKYHHTFSITQALVGATAIEAEGEAISDTTMQLCQQSDAILFGAVGGAPRVGGPRSTLQPESALFRLRKELALYANLRPIRPFNAL
ncbi:MAG: isocitrate/isopropylmalate family dehydrogenase, partial [Chloroflexota bacterium]|nr:isocitrate/isopropylmalate family dehydrogenase [Chloroflexota bacterium]